MKIFHSSGFSASFIRYFSAKTHTKAHISSFFFLSLSCTCPTLCGVYFLFLSVTALLFTSRSSPPARYFTQTSPTFVCLQFYSFITYILSIYRYYFDTAAVALECDLYRILSYQTDSNIAGFRPHYAITVRCGVSATVSFKAAAC